MKEHAFKHLFVQATYAFTGSLLGRLSAAAAGIVMARSLQAEMFGVYSTLWELTLLCGSFTETGMTVGVQRDGASDHTKLGLLFGNAFFVRLLIGFPALVIAYFFSARMAGGISYNAIYIALSLASAAVFLSEPMYSVLQVLGKQKNIAIVESLRGFITLIGIVILVIFKRGIVEMAWLQGVVYAGMFFVLARSTLPCIQVEVNLRSALSQFKTSFIFGVSTLVFSIYSRVPILLLSYLQGPVAVGYYAAAYRIISMVYVVGAGVYQRAFLPSLFGYYKKNLTEFQSASNFMQQYFVVFGFFCAIGLFVGADTIIVVLMGKSYYAGVSIMRILSVSVFINFMLYAADATLTAGNQNYAKIYIQIIGTVVGAAGGYFFIQYFGAKGAAFTDILIRAVQMVLFFVLVYKLRYMSFKPIIRLAVPFILILLISLVLVKIMPHAYIMRPIFALVIVTPVLIYLIGLKKIRSLISR